MQVYLERSGGVTGMTLRRSLSSDELGPAESHQLQSLVDAATFFDLPNRMESPKPDRFHYKLTVETGQQTHTVDADEAAVPDSLRPLLDWVLRSGHKP